MVGAQWYFIQILNKKPKPYILIQNHTQSLILTSRILKDGEILNYFEVQACQRQV